MKKYYVAYKVYRTYHNSKYMVVIYEDGCTIPWKNIDIPFFMDTIKKNIGEMYSDNGLIAYHVVITFICETV